MQASVIMASFVYNAAMRDQRMPRKALPKDEPAVSPVRGTQEAQKP